MTSALSAVTAQTPGRKVSFATLESGGNPIITVLAHELRGRLACIRSASDLLELETVEGPIRQQVVGIVSRQVGGMLRLVDDLIGATRLRSGDMEMERELTPLADIIEQTLEVVQPIVAARKHAFVIELPSRPLHLDCDQTWLSQALQNLVINAANYTDPGGRICFNVQQEGPYAMIRVKDTGKGIASGDLDTIFDLYARAGQTGTSPAIGGLGVGLHLARVVIEAHGGCIHASSPGPGCGSEFVVRLPANG